MTQQTAGGRTAQINERLITLLPKETLLQGALRSGIELPNGCRVGGCGACKCRLVEGEVRELTETGYLLSKQEIDDGYILACQSVAKSHVRIEVDLAKATSARRVSGKVVGQHIVTHDIVHLTVRLEEPLAYEPGQYARVSAEALPGVVRSYSFASPPREDGIVEFYVREVRGGAFSTLVNRVDLVGTRVDVEGPEGDFWLRPSDAPLVLVAGGSGLPPLLAMLEAAAAAGVERPVTVLFGARERRDLYALDRIEAVSRAWSGKFQFVPVLSEADADVSWEGARGLVTDVLSDLVAPGSHAYLCGPPKMVDAAADVLRAKGVLAEHVHFDRFTTLADVVAKAPEAGLPPENEDTRGRSRLVDVMHYVKFFGFHAVGLAALAAIVMGGPAVTIGLVAVLAFYLLGDAFLGDDTSTPKFRHPAVLTAQLWLALPLLALIVLASVWSVSSGDALGFGALVSRWTGHDVIAARDATTFGHHVSGWVLTGLMIGMIGTIPAHELTHRTWDPVSMFVGRWLLAFSFDTSFAIEHVYGHHRYVSTTDDPATAPRGRNVYAHVVISTLRGNASAWHIEADRLRKRGFSAFSPRNAFIRGHLMSALLVVAAYAIGGGTAALYFVACALWGKALLEIVNYMEHYGMVRNPATPVQPRHSWNTNRRISSWTLFNLTRHSHHHAQGEVAYHDLRPYPDAPMMVGGYLTTLVVAMLPPLWHALMTRKVLDWDRDHATAEERALAAAANARSGVPGLSREAAVPVAAHPIP